MIHVKKRQQAVCEPVATTGMERAILATEQSRQKPKLQEGI
jgi:hypothetical protein